MKVYVVLMNDNWGDCSDVISVHCSQEKAIEKGKNCEAEFPDDRQYTYYVLEREVED